MHVYRRYGHSMRGSLPLNSFRWLSPPEMERLDWTRMTETQEWGYIAEVDLEYPAELHLKHDSMPLCPESYTVTEKELSEYSLLCHEMLSEGSLRSVRRNKAEVRVESSDDDVDGREGDDDDDGDAGDGLLREMERCAAAAAASAREAAAAPKYRAQKLCGTLHDKVKYSIHYMHLRFVLQSGLKLRKVHRVIAFRQKPFLRAYIDLMTAKRINAKTEFSRNHYKIYLNAIYGECVGRASRACACPL